MELNRPIKKKRALWLLLLLVPIFLAACPVVYSLGALSQARKLGVYASPQEAAAAIAEHDFPGRITYFEIRSAGINRHDGQDPHIWFVTERLCMAGNQNGVLWRGSDCVDGGSYYLHMRDGWVLMPETYFPEFVGWWMKKLGLAGE